MKFILYLTTFFVINTCIIKAQVIDLDDTFDVHPGDDTPWLVEFYAPWCGHCKKLEPIYHQVSLDLDNSAIKVAKIDATKYSSISAKYDVQGFPTIKFIQGERIFTHRGDRTKESIVEFAKRAIGPNIKQITNSARYFEIRSEHADTSFFLYIGSHDGFTDMMSKYAAVADKLAVHSYYYSCERKVLPEEFVKHLKFDPTVVVFKDKEWHEYEPNDSGRTRISLEAFIQSERHLAFPKLSGGGGLHDMSDMKKKIAIFVFDEQNKESEALTTRIKDLVNTLATKYRKHFHKHFQFVWMEDPDTINSITMATLKLPALIVFDTETQYYYLPEFDLKDITYSSMTTFFDAIRDGSTPVFGGTGFLQRIKRIFFDIYIAVYSIFEASVWLGLLVFGLPSTVISIVCYALCCMEPIDDTYDTENDEYLMENENATEDIVDAAHPKKE